MRLPRTSIPEFHTIDDEQTAPSSDKTLRLVDSMPAFADAATIAPEHTNGDVSLRPLLEAVLTELRAQRNRNTRVVVKTGGKVLFLRADQIEWVEAAGNYVKLHVGGDAHLFRESMKNMETRLDGDRFVRIHRSAIVNVDHIRELQPWFHGEYVVLLHDGTRLMASRVFSDRLSRLIA
ncbi:MAG TPA: LytTR family DNA-binding domain-containing protein [Gemmatimonadaceae bacterium]|nr:LytTR family DNA-binding domain-containing protein [Gemmatimonadaceae bacterium]